MSVYIAKAGKTSRKAMDTILHVYQNRINATKGVFIKPNIVFPLSEKSGQITRHRIVKALIEALREKYAGFESSSGKVRRPERYRPKTSRYQGIRRLPGIMDWSFWTSIGLNM